MAKKKTKGTEDILCAGFGGQGIMFMGKLLAEAALMAGRHVTWMPSYGAEVRGGTAYSMVRISTGEIASPLVTHPDILVAMNGPSLIKYEPMVKEGALVISNKSLISGPVKGRNYDVLNIPMTAIASDLGSTKCANMVAVGIIAKRSRMLSVKHLLGALRQALKDKEDVFLLNKKALEKGCSIK